MMISLQSYVRRGKHRLRALALDPRAHLIGRLGSHFLAGFALSAASLAHSPQPLTLGLVCACSGWPAVLVALGGSLGYLVFWGSAGYQGIIWLAAGAVAAVLLGDRRVCADTPLLMPALAGLVVAASGLAIQSLLQDDTAVPVYVLRVALGAGAAWVFSQVINRRNPILEWVACSMALLALAQIVIFPWLSLGYIAAGALAVAGAFPAAALAGLALDLAGITPVSMTAVLCASYLIRFFPRYPKWLGSVAPVLVYLTVMSLCGKYDMNPVVGLTLGGVVGCFLPSPGKLAHRRGETGIAQVRLEMAAGVLAQTEQLLLETPEVPVDEDALVARAAERACGGCPCRKGCKDSRRIQQLPAALLHKPLLTSEELPIVCRKSGRFLAELHRSQEQLRSIRADRDRQREYRAAVVQQFRFLSEYLQELSDQLSRRLNVGKASYAPFARAYGNRPAGDNGDRFLSFPGTQSRHYVLLCDGMGTGLGAVHEGRTAGSILRRLLTAGYPAEHALRSLNSLCALRERAGAVTVDLAELHLDTGKAILYKWGAAPSYLVSTTGAEKIGVVGPPPGLGVTDYQETVERLTLRRGEILVMASDGISQEQALRCCRSMAGMSAPELASGLLACGQLSGEDDATLVLIRLDPSVN